MSLPNPGKFFTHLSVIWPGFVGIGELWLRFGCIDLSYHRQLLHEFTVSGCGCDNKQFAALLELFHSNVPVYWRLSCGLAGEVKGQGYITSIRSKAVTGGDSGLDIAVRVSQVLP